MFVDIGVSKCAKEVCADLHCPTPDFCDSLLDCQNLTAFKHQNTFDLIQKSIITDSNHTPDNLQRLLFEKLGKKFRDCKLSSWRLIQLVVRIFNVIIFLLEGYIDVAVEIVVPIIVKVLYYFVSFLDDGYVSESVETVINHM